MAQKIQILRHGRQGHIIHINVYPCCWWPGGVKRLVKQPKSWSWDWVHTDIIPWHRQGINGCTSLAVGLIRVGANRNWNSAKCYWTDHQTWGIIMSASSKFELNSISALSANMRNMLDRSGPRKGRKFTEGQKSVRRGKFHDKCIHQVCDQLPWAFFISEMREINIGMPDERTGGRRMGPLLYFNVNG